MARVKRGSSRKNNRKKVLNLAEGYFGSKHRLFKVANQQVMKSLAYSYRDRKKRKSDFRKLWIARINAASRQENISYSVLMHGLKLANIDINRKMLAELAVSNPDSFKKIVDTAKKSLESSVS